jgi:hypothetical protein
MQLYRATVYRLARQYQQVEVEASSEEEARLLMIAQAETRLWIDDDSWDYEFLDMESPDESQPDWIREWDAHPTVN